MLLPNITVNFPRQIAVIGAGMAGLACAEALAAAGHHVSLFEKSRGLGGRMSTRRSSNTDDSWQCDHGVSLFTARSNEFRQKVACWQRAGIIDSIDNVEPQQERSRLYYGVPRMNSIAHHMLNSCQHLSGSITCHLNTRVNAIQRHSTGWSLSTATPVNLAQNTWQAVVLAIPAAQAASLLESSSAAYKLAQTVKMLPCWVVIAVPEHPLELPWKISTKEGSPLEKVLCDSNKKGRTGRQTWLLQARADWSNTQLNASPESVTQQLLTAFNTITGSTVGNMQTHAHRWLYATSRGVNAHKYWLDNATGLSLCGDWLLQGDVESAWLSGNSLGHTLNRWLAQTSA